MSSSQLTPCLLPLLPPRPRSNTSPPASPRRDLLYPKSHLPRVCTTPCTPTPPSQRRLSVGAIIHPEMLRGKSRRSLREAKQQQRLRAAYPSVTKATRGRVLPAEFPPVGLLQAGQPLQGLLSPTLPLGSLLVVTHIHTNKGHLIATSSIPPSR